MGESIIPDSTLESLPVLALRNSVLFPAAVVPVNVGRPRSVRLIEEAFGLDRPTIGVIAQRKPDDEDPAFEGLFRIGTLARVLKVIRLSSGQYSVVLQGISRMRLLAAVAREPCLRGRVQRIVEQHGGRYQTVAYGAAVLSRDLDALVAAHGNADRSNLRLLRIYQAGSDLLEVETAGGTRYAPLYSARASLPLQRTDAFGRPSAALADEAELLPALRAAAKRNLDEHR